MRWPFPHFPYPPAKPGYWSPVTSTLNWCEEVCLFRCRLSLPGASGRWTDLTLLGLLCYRLLRRDRQHCHQPVVYVVRYQGSSQLSP